MTSRRWIWGMAAGALMAAGLGLLLKKEPSLPTPNEPQPRKTATVVVSSVAESSPTPIVMMAAAAPTNTLAEPTNTPTVGIALPDSVTTPTLSPEDAEKLKEVATYRNEEYGFAFQYPKFRTLSDGSLKENREYQMHAGLDSVPLDLTWYGTDISLIAVKKSSDFSTLQAYVEKEYQETEEMLEEQRDMTSSCRERRVNTIQIAHQQAFLEECWRQGQPESTIFIEGNDYLYHIYWPNHLGVTSQKGETQQGRQFLQMLLDTWSFSQEGQGWRY